MGIRSLRLAQERVNRFAIRRTRRVASSQSRSMRAKVPTFAADPVHARPQPMSGMPEGSSLWSAGSGARLGRLSEFDDPGFRTLLRQLVDYSDGYVAGFVQSPQFPKEYPWPRDALRCNTRLWEYPFAWHAIRRWAPENGAVLDIGSALTFFPSFLAHHGYSATASDRDRRMLAWMDRGRPNIGREFGREVLDRLSYCIEDVTSLSMDDEVFDVVTNISVLEHLPMSILSRAVGAIRRVLRPGGLLVCTLDVWIGGHRSPEHHPLDVGEFKAFMDAIEEHFTLVEPPAVTLPSDMITNRVYPRELAADGAKPRRRRLRPLRALRALVDRPEAPPLEWAVFGFVARKDATT
jgi:SAM-dependent methyltransferase